MSAGSCTVTVVHLPGGSEAVLRALLGTDEEWFASLPPETPEPEFVTALLARSVRFIDGQRALPDVIRKLTPGDRDFLLLQVARVTFGPWAELLLTCKDGACGARMHATFDIQQVPLEARRVQPSYLLRLLDGREIVFRLPVGEDQEAAAGWHGLTREERRARFLARCVLSGGEILEDSAGQFLSEAIQAVAPKVDLEFSAPCPECGRESIHRLDPANWLISELRRRFPLFEREVHLLSLHYHWALREVLSMPCERRTRWVNLLTREMGHASAAHI